MQGEIVRCLMWAAIICSLPVLVVHSQQQRSSSSVERSRRVSQAESNLTGVYRIDIARSDKLYSVVAGASSNLPFGEQQRFFIDLAVRLTPPDLLAIEQRGRTISIASSRAPRLTFEANGVTQRERSSDGRLMRTRAVLSGGQLTVSTSGSLDDNFTVTFEPTDGGRWLSVTRRIYAAQLTEPVVVRSVYEKISDVAQWSIYVDSETATTNQTPASAPVKSVVAKNESNEANVLRSSLDEWVAATNARDIKRLINFYMPEIKAFYLARNVPRSFVRAERARTFERAGVIDVRAQEPEIIFRDGGRRAVMRYRKQYTTEMRGQKRQGEVIQELRWEKTESGWRIFSERDVRVIR